MSKEGVLTVNTGGGATIETLSSEGGPPTQPNGHNFNFSGSIAGGSAANGAIEFIIPGGPGQDEIGQMDAKVLVDGTTIEINASNELQVVGGAFSESFTVDASTAPGTNPVEPNGSGNITVTGGQVAAGTTSNVIRTDSLAANTYTIQVQRSQAVASSTIGDNGVSHFNSAQFTVDGNGFVSANGSGIGETITGNTGGALSPTAGNWNILGASTSAGTTPVTTSGSGSTLTVDVQKSQAIASTNASNVGLSAFNSAQFTVDSNGFVSISGTGATETLTGNTGGAIAPVANNINTVGTGSITIAGSGNTLTTELTGLTNHAVLVGAGTTTITKVGPTATAGQVLQSAGSTSDPVFSTATYPSTTTANDILYSSATNVVGQITGVNQAVLTTGTGGVPALTSLAGNGQLIIGSTAGAPAAATLTAGTGISITNASNAITIAVSGTAVGETITGDTGGALSPTAGNWNILANPTAGASVKFEGSGSTLTLNTSDANNNTFVGVASGNATLTSILCTGFGSNTLHALTSGNDNCAYGFDSLASLTTGSNNVCYGNSSGGVLLTGSSNLLMGFGGAFGAGTQYTGAESSNLILSNAGVTGDNNTIRIGTQGSSAGQQNKCFIAGIEGVTVSNLNIVTINTSTGQLGSQAASNVGTVTQYDVLVGGASGAIASVGPGSSGQVLQSGGNAANPAYSTATYPSTATSTGTILRADGTNWSATTATYPNTTTSQQILYSTANNVIGELTTANSKLPATNASGTLAMRAFSVNKQVFSSSGTYTPTTGMLYCDVICIGGGGAGGGAPTTSSTQFSSGTGGGAGEYAVGTFSSGTIGASQTVTIGAAGTGSAGTTGGNGGTTSLGSLITAVGGTGGTTIAAATAGAAGGGLGGTGGTGGSYRTPGSMGGTAFFSVTGGAGFGGQGGNGQLGAGGSGTNFNSAGGAALGYGAGGGGPTNAASQATARAGGNGTAGFICITEYIIN